MTQSTSVGRRRRLAQRAFAPLAIALCSAFVTPAFASETVTYSYDAKGRLTSVSHAGGPANGTSAIYVYDAADNRTNVSVSGAIPRVVVVPLNGLSLITLSPD